jgi:hypothetical protein
MERVEVTSVLPALTREVAIKGYRSEGAPAVVIDGSGQPSGNGVTLRAGGTVQDLSVVGFPGYGLVVRDGSITGSYLGVLPDGRTVQLNRFGGVSALENTVVGGPSPAADEGSCPPPCNLIAGNRDSQVNIGESGVQVLGNLIGVLPDGTVAPGQSHPIRAPGGSLQPTSNVVIGGESDARNRIAAPSGLAAIRLFRALGPASQTIQVGPNMFIGAGSSIVDLNETGILPNDAGDADSGTNTLLNFPFVTSAQIEAGCSLRVRAIVAPGTTVESWLAVVSDKLAHAGTVVEGSAADESGETDSYSDPELGTDSANVIEFTVALREFEAAHEIVLLARDDNGNTSESIAFELPEASEDCTSVCYSDEDGDGVTGTRQTITSDACSDYSTNGTPWTFESDGDCVDDAERLCSANAYPGAPEVCDGCDNDCDGLIDDEDPDIATGDPDVTLAAPARYYPDNDSDDCGAEGSTGIFACDPPEGFAQNALDEDDSDGICCGNGVIEGDELCDGAAIGDATCPSGTAGTPLCKNDGRHPNEDGTCTFGSGTPSGCGTGTTCFADLDGDGFTGSIVALDPGDDRECSEVTSGPAATPWTSSFGGDCEDQPSNDCATATYPGAPELCDGCDNDCDFETSDGSDEQSFGMPCDGRDADNCAEGVIQCDQSSFELFCTDNTDSTYEVCDAEGLDENCNGLSNSNDPSLSESPSSEDIVIYYRDEDGDGCGVFGEQRAFCVDEIPESGWADNANDDDDTDGDCCGDGLVTGDEECDPEAGALTCSEFGAGEGTVTCSQECATDFSECVPEGCGDGVLAGEETCDPASEFAPENCRNNCTYCGDGILNPESGESCDPLSSEAPDNCRDDCTYCGDGFVSTDAGETCDPAAEGAPAACDPVTCTTCGDGVVEPEFGEECDEGQENTDTCEYGEESCEVCSTTCEEVSGSIQRCGDGDVQTEQGEECDDGNTITEACTDEDCEVCRANCTVFDNTDPECGDGVVQTYLGEECEPVSPDDQECTDECSRPGSAGSGGDSGCAVVAPSAPQTTVFAWLALMLGLAAWSRRRSRKD